MEQHDDHIWFNVNGKSWAIQFIERGPPLVFYLWRGYWPNLEFTAYEFINPDWKGYCEAAVQMLRERYPDT